MKSDIPIITNQSIKKIEIEEVSDQKIFILRGSPPDQGPNGAYYWLGPVQNNWKSHNPNGIGPFKNSAIWSTNSMEAAVEQRNFLQRMLRLI